MHTLGTVREPPVRISSLRLRRVVGWGAPRDVTTLRYSVVAIFGPTASGKSEIAHELATRLRTEVVSADALQVYDGLPILTNQSPRHPARLTAIRTLADEMSVGAYAPLAHAEIDDLIAANGTAVVAGGTGLYLRAALAELAIPDAVSPEARARCEGLYETDPGAAHARLARLDPDAAATVHVNDRRRVVRALELAEAGRSLVPTTDALWSSTMRHPTLVIGLEIPPSTLDERIHARTREMISRGAPEEARAALASPISRTAAQALGLVELTTLPLDEAAERIDVRTRRYAGYQRKWMRGIPGIQLVSADRPVQEVVGEILDLARAR
jgi:tRNA dimethylallyltransferase